MILEQTLSTTKLDAFVMEGTIRRGQSKKEVEVAAELQQFRHRRRTVAASLARSQARLKFKSRTRVPEHFFTGTGCVKSQQEFFDNTPLDALDHGKGFHIVMAANLTRNISMNY